MKKLSICIPCYNEEKSIEEMYVRLTNKNFGFHRNVFESFKYASGDCVF